ncbi:MAG: hypothetical protein IJ338_04705 [Bacteroidaceae bacterium]|nr:hypothetical protein [Bacteroidaceae bacterium]
MKSIISLLLNLQGKNSQCASFSAFDENEDALLPTVLPSTTTEKRNLFTLKEKFRKYLKRFYSHIFFSDAKRILFHSGGYTERRTKDSFSTAHSIFPHNKSYSLQQLLHAIETLEDSKKAIISMHFSGFYLEEIAQHLSISIDSINCILPKILEELDVITSNIQN